MKSKTVVIAVILVSFTFPAKAQYSSLNAHSHNDYANETPFLTAYNNHFGSIEADIWAVDGELYVGHNASDIKTSRTLDILYLQPILKFFEQNNGKPWNDSGSTFQLLIDLKTTVEPTLSLLVEKLKKYPQVFDPVANKHAIMIVITGNRPDPEAFEKYPRYIFFDGLLKLKYSPDELKRVPLFSENIKQFSLWNGMGEIPDTEKTRLTQITDSLHSLNKKIRFWNCPDNKNSWETYINIGIDYLNTDHIIELSEYLKNRNPK
jgi:alkaline phosphatase